MKKIEFLAASLPYDIQVMKICGDGVYDTIDKLTIRNLYEFGISRFKPIIRPLESLTKECVQADYNNGEPFIPILELAEMVSEKYAGLYSDKDGNIIVGYDETYGEDEYEVVDTHIFSYDSDRICFIDKNYFDNDGDVRENSSYIIKDICSFKLIQQLLKWHFWPNMPEGEEVVYVTDEFNPYK